MPLLQEPITSSQFIKRMSERLTVTLNRKVSQREAKAILRATTGELLDTVADGNDVVMWGFGRFCLRRYGNNSFDAEGNPIKYAALGFRCSKKVRDYVTSQRLHQL